MVIGCQVFFSRSRNILCCKYSCNTACGFSAHKKMIYSSDKLCLFLINNRWVTLIFATLIPEKVLVRQNDLTIGEPFSLSPGYIFQNTATLLLCQWWHNGKQQFAIAVEYPYVLFFKINPDVLILQLANCNKAVYRISSKTAHWFYNNKVYFTDKRIGNNFIKSIPSYRTIGQAYCTLRFTPNPLLSADSSYRQACSELLPTSINAYRTHTKNRRNPTPCGLWIFVYYVLSYVLTLHHCAAIKPLLIHFHRKSNSDSWFKVLPHYHSRELFSMRLYAHCVTLSFSEMTNSWPL